MKKTVDTKTTPTEHKIKRSMTVTVICDVVLIVILIISIFVYVTYNSQSIYKQNIENINNIATAKSELMLTALQNIKKEVESAFKYCNGKSEEEAMQYLTLIGDKDDEYQLLTFDTTASALYPKYNGFSTKKDGEDYQQLCYDNTALAVSIYNFRLQDDGVIGFSQSFTNVTDALSYFGAFCSLTLQNGTETQTYYLVKLQKERTMLDQLGIYPQYAEISTAICYMNGKYMAADNFFRADNFFEYLYKYNLSTIDLDKRDQIKIDIQSDVDGSGYFEYNDYKNRNCVFVYNVCGNTNNWCVIVAVPTEEFVSGSLITVFSATIILFLIVLLVFNIWRLATIVNELKLSVKREQIANISKSTFLSRMSHEIRTPLNAIIGYNTISRNSLSKAKSNDDRRQTEMKIMDYLQKSDMASKHLLTIINDVLDMSAIDSGKIKVVKEKFDFKGLLNSLTTVFYSQSRDKGVNFEVLFDTLTEEWFEGDSLRISQVMTNLLSNAVKFTAEGGCVKLKINQISQEEKATHFRFEVSDMGIGMAQGFLSHIWDPFEQADSSISRRFGGTGLGLSITKSLVDLMGGTISVSSILGVGTVFTVDLTFGRVQQPYEYSAYNFETINALVVDDDKSTCDYIKLLFERCGAKAHCVTQSEDAIKAVKLSVQNNTPYTLCLIDWKMPKVDGVETARQIRSIVGEDLPIIVITAYDYSEVAENSRDVNIDKFISKPLFQSSLFDLLASISGYNVGRTATIAEKYDFNGAQVLLVEDNEMNMEIAKNILESVNINVECARNGKQAVDAFLNSDSGKYKAILMDVHMPVMDGHEATRTIRASSHPDAKTIPIIAMTADAFAENVAEAHAAGMNKHIAKPIEVRTLFAVLKEFIVN